MRQSIIAFLLLVPLVTGCDAPQPAPIARLDLCFFRPNGAACDDGNACNGPEACRARRCVNLGRWSPDGTTCADDDRCNGLEVCEAGTCVAGTPLVIDDENPCTEDGCSNERGVFHDPVTCSPDGTDFLPGGTPLPIVIAGARWPLPGHEAEGDGAFVTLESFEDLHLSIYRQAVELASYLDAAADLPGGFQVLCAGAGCPAEHALPAGAPAIWFGTAADFADDPVVLAAFPAPHADVDVPLEERQRYILRPAGPSYYIIGAGERATDPAMWALLHELGHRHFAPGPAWEILPQLPSPAIVTANRDETPRALFHGFIFKPDPQSGFGQGEWLRHNRFGDDSLRALQGQAVTGSNYHPALPFYQHLTRAIPSTLSRWLAESAPLMPPTAQCLAACPEDAPPSCAFECLNAATVPAETLCLSPFPDSTGITMASADPATQAVIDDYFTALAIGFFRAYPHADVFSLELLDKTTPCCDGGCCDASCEIAPGSATTDAYISLANRVAERVRTCPASLCPWNDPLHPQRRFIDTALYNQTAAPPTIAYDADVIASVNLDHGPAVGVSAVTDLSSSLVGFYAYETLDHGQIMNLHPANAPAYLARFAAPDAQIAPRTNQFWYVETSRRALVSVVQWQSVFAYGWDSPGTIEAGEALVEDFFVSAFPEPASRERIRRLYQDLQQFDETPSTQLLGRAHWHVHEAQTLAAALCTPEVCGAPGSARYQRMFDRFASFTLLLRRDELVYGQLAPRPVPGVLSWFMAVDPAWDPAPLCELLARTMAVEGGQGAALFDYGDYTNQCATWNAAHPAPQTPYSTDEIAAFSLAGRELYPAGWLAPPDGVPALRDFSDALVALPPGVPVACAGDTCASFPAVDAPMHHGYAALDYQLVLGSDPVLPQVVGLKAPAAYFVQRWSDVEHRWVDVFGGRAIPPIPANCAPLPLTAADTAELATLAGQRIRLLAPYGTESSPGVCEDAGGGAWRVARGPLSPRGDFANGVPMTIRHFFVPPGLDQLDVYGMQGACLVAPGGDTIAVGAIADDSCHFDGDVPCPCAADGTPIVDDHHQFVAGTFLREASIPLPAGSWGVWRMYQNPINEAAPMTLRNAPPFFAARPELLAVPAECVTADGQGLVTRCGE